MRTWGESGAARAIRRAKAVSAYARRTGCGVDEAGEVVEDLSRRRFLMGAGAALTGAALPVASASAHRGIRLQPRSADAPKVVIVGAGIAGLGCAYRLWRDQGIRSEVYEYNVVPG